MEQQVYTKHNSFHAIRCRQGGAAEVLPRVRWLRDRLDACGLPDDRCAVVGAACEELLGPGMAPETAPRFVLHPYVAEEMVQLTDEELPRYLWYRYRYEIYPQRKLLDAFPPCLQVEPVSSCNYRCVFCFQTDRAFTDRGNGRMGMMDPDLFRRVIDEAEGRCEAVTLASRGEPLLHPELPELLAYAAGKFLALKLNTNASRLTERVAHAILEADVSTVVFSVDAAAEPAYSRLRVGGSLETVLANIRRFQEIRTKRYPRSRMITRVSGVNVAGSSSLQEMERVWGDLVDQVAFVTYNPWENTYERPVNRLTTPCSDLWRRAFVWWDGRVNPCDVDYLSTLSVGNVQQHGVKILWRSEPYERLRQHHLQQQRGQCSPCNRCTVV